MKRIAVLLCSAAVSAGAVVPLAASPAAAKQPNIVSLAASAPQFSTLVTLVKQAGLVKALSAPGELTVFAPTNAAFNALAKAHPALYAKVAHSTKLLKSVLLYHVAKGQLLAKQLVKRSSLTTLLGQKLALKVKHGSLYVNQARVVTPNLLASNGVVHAVNAVLVPKL